MKTTQEIINSNQTHKDFDDDWGRKNRNRVYFSDYHSDSKDKKWYSEEEIKSVIKTINDRNNLIEDFEVELKKELFGEENGKI